MINCKPYSHTFTEDLRLATINRDVPFFRKEIKKLCAVVAARDGNFNNDTEYDAEVSRLQVCLAIHDSLTRKGQTIQFICDMVNF